jgi:signal peptidase I
MPSTADVGDAAQDAASEDQGTGAKPPARRRLRTLTGWAVTLLVAVVLAFTVQALVFQVFSIPTSSMEPTLGISDRILVWKAFANWHDVHQGDIVVFTHPPLDRCPGPADSDLVKRVVALPGQAIYSAGGHVYVNGRRLPEPYLPPHTQPGPPIPGATRQAPFHVPPGELYVMGDNRGISCDSRYWGPIRGTSIVGRAVLRIWHDGHPDFHIF